MPMESQTDLFIRTLSELRDHARESRNARIRQQIRDYVNRFVDEFRTDLTGRDISREVTSEAGGASPTSACAGAAPADSAHPRL